MGRIKNIYRDFNGNGKLVYICSPLSGDIPGNIEKARGYCKLALCGGAIPYAPHLALYGVLDDTNTVERNIAIEICLEVIRRCDQVWVFGDYISAGMKLEIETASEKEIPIKFINGEAKE